MGGTSSYLAILCIIGFLSAAWFATRISRLLGVSSIVLEIAVGIILGPHIAGLMSDEYATCDQRLYTDCTLPEDFNYRVSRGLSIGEDLDKVAHQFCWSWAPSYPQYGDLGTQYPGQGTQYGGQTQVEYGGSSSGQTGGGGGQTQVEENGGGSGQPNGGQASTSMQPNQGSGTQTQTEAPPTAPPTQGGQWPTQVEYLDSATNNPYSTTNNPYNEGSQTQVEYGGSTGGQAQYSTTFGDSPRYPTQVEPSDLQPIYTTVYPGGVGTTTYTRTRITTTTEPTLAPTRTPGWEDEDDTVFPMGGNDDTDGSIGRLLSVSLEYEAAERNGGQNFDSYAQCISKSCKAHVSHDCALAPDVWTLIGHTGVGLMLFESGLHFDFEKAKVVGKQASAVALLGVILPLVTGTGLMMIFGYPLSPDGVSVGTALAPTSVGLALRLLGEAGVLQHEFSQTIVASAFFSDILSLVLYDVICSLRGKFDVIATVVYPIVGVVFMLICMAAAVKIMPKVINELILPRLPACPNRTVPLEDEGLFVLMIALLVGCATVTHYLNMYLWGCCIAGMCFACLDKDGRQGHAHHIWVRQTKRITSWMIRIFFACTVAFSIPIPTMFSAAAFLKGSAMGIGPCILTKVLSAPFMGSARFVIGWAMVGRAEFAYFIAQMFFAGDMINEETFSICIWALLWPTIFSPIIFRTVLLRYVASEGLETTPPVHEDELSDQGEEEDVAGSRKPVSAASAAAAADYRQETVAASKRKVDFDSNAGSLEKTEFGKFGDFKKIAVDVDGRQAAAENAAPTTRRLWFGRASPPSVADSPNGFLCCLFLRRYGVN